VVPNFVFVKIHLQMWRSDSSE